MKHFENECDCLIRPCNMLIIFHIQNFREIWKYSCVQCSSSFRHFLWAVRRWFQKKSTKMGRTNSRVWMPEFRHFCQHHVASFAQNEKAILSVQILARQIRTTSSCFLRRIAELIHAGHGQVAWACCLLSIFDTRITLHGTYCVNYCRENLQLAHPFIVTGEIVWIQPVDWPLRHSISNAVSLIMRTLPSDINNEHEQYTRRFYKLKQLDSK